MANVVVVGGRGAARADAPARWRLWRNWVAANALGELIGLGLAGLIGVALVRVIEALLGAAAPLVVAVIMVAAGTLEGAIVGFAQWRVLRQPFPSIRARAWVLATALGSLLAWTLGMIPSTVLSLGADADAPASAEPPALLFFGLAALLGLALGPFLGVPQWLILRRAVPRAGLWVSANMLAWAVGMPLVFLGASNVPTGWPLAGIAALVLATAATAGAAVGAVHGLVLVRLAGELTAPAAGASTG